VVAWECPFLADSGRLRCPPLAESGPLRLLTDRWQSGQTDDYSPLIASIGRTGRGEGPGLLRMDMTSSVPLSSIGALHQMAELHA